MSLLPRFSILPLLTILTACSGPKSLETRIGSRRTDSLTAKAEKVDGRWRVRLPLPAGSWKVTTEEDQPFVVQPGDPKSTLEWTVTPDRWAQQDRPFRFTLVDASGMTLEFSVVYPNLMNLGQAVLLQMLCLGGNTAAAPR